MGLGEVRVKMISSVKFHTEHRDTLLRWAQQAAQFNRTTPPPDPVQHWINEGQPRHLDRGAKLPKSSFEAPNDLFLVITGMMALQVEDNIAASLTLPCFHGGLLGIDPGPGRLGPDLLRSKHLVALTPVTGWVLPRRGFEAMAKDADCQTYFYRRLHMDLNLAVNMIALSRIPDSATRIARNLVMLSGVIGSRHDNTLILPIRQQTLGDMTGLSRERTSKTISSFQDKGTLETGYEKIYVHDERALLAACRWKDLKAGTLARIHTLEETLS